MLTPGYHGPVLRTVLLTAVLLPWAASAAGAETVRLRSGKSLDVDAVHVLEDRIRITIFKGGGTAKVDLRFALLDASDLLRLLDRHTDAQDGALRLRSAQVALERGLRHEAAQRFREAARLDAALEQARDAGLARIAALEAAAGLAELEAQLRGGADPHGAMALAAALQGGPVGPFLSPRQRLRVETLAALARRLFKRDQRRAARALLALPAADSLPAVAAPGAAGDDPLAARLRALEAKAVAAREAAADPLLADERVLRHLDVAATALLDARRALRDAPAEQLGNLLPVGARLSRLLVATYLDQADLFRLRGQWGAARARVRAVLILDPGNEDAWSQRTLIERDLLRETTPVAGSGRGFESYYYSPSPFLRTYGFRPVPLGLGHHQARGGFHVHYGRASHGRTQRAVGRRR